jgi:hypothetical protein
MCLRFAFLAAVSLSPERSEPQACRPGIGSIMYAMTR